MLKQVWLFSLPLLAACGGVGEPTSATTTGSGGAGGSALCPNDLPESCPSPAPTWKADVAPMIEDHCVTCHAAGGTAADKPLTTYAQLFSRKGGVLNQVYGCDMPPEGANPLSKAERLTIESWLVCGAPDD